MREGAEGHREKEREGEALQGKGAEFNLCSVGAVSNLFEPYDSGILDARMMRALRDRSTDSPSLESRNGFARKIFSGTTTTVRFAKPRLLTGA